MKIANMKYQARWVGFLAVCSLSVACGSSAPAAEAAIDGNGTPSEPSEESHCSEHAKASPAHCECLGGYVKGDIGDGKVACGPGEVELERTNQGIEGAVCCQAARDSAPAPHDEQPVPQAGEPTGSGSASAPGDAPTGSPSKPGEAGAPNAGRICGTRGAGPCSKGEFCDFSLNAKCGMTDHAGSCKQVPEMCTEEYMPVCGCDNKTHSNRCAANRQGVAVLHEGKCK